MIKEVIAEYACRECGNMVAVKREIVIDEYLKKIEIPFPERCPCSSAKYLLGNLKLVDKK